MRHLLPPRSPASLRALALAFIAAGTGCTSGSERSIFTDDFDGHRLTAAGVAATWSGPATIEPVQGFATTGFHGNFLRNTTAGDSAAPTVLTLRGLPPHSAITIGFLLALIDTWDGTCGEARVAAGGAIDSDHCPDFFNVTVDGRVVFRETFFFEDPVPQSYDEARGTLLSRGKDLGFNDLWGGSNGGRQLDLAFDMRREATFNRIPHTADTVVIALFANGAGWQGGGDESWAIDNVAVAIVPRAR